MITQFKITQIKISMIIFDKTSGFPLANLRASNCILSEHKAWNVPLLLSILNQQVLEHIVNEKVFYGHKPKLKKIGHIYIK